MSGYTPELEKRCDICEWEYPDSDLAGWENPAGYFQFCTDCLKEAPRSAWDIAEKKPRDRQEFLKWFEESSALGEPISEETWEEDY